MALGIKTKEVFCKDFLALVIVESWHQSKHVNENDKNCHIADSYFQNIANKL